MKKNMGNVDRPVRIVLAILVLILFLTDILTGTPGILLLVLAGILVLTGFIGFCPLYLLFGIRTCKKS